MKERIGSQLAAWAVIVAFAVCICGCSPSIGQWVDRGVAGVETAKSNQTAWYQAEVQRLNQARITSINAAYLDTVSVIQHGVPTSQPAAATRPVDAAWVDAQRRVLLATMAAYDAEKLDLDTKYATAMANLASTEECFTQIKRLNVAWATTADQLAADVNALSAIVTQLQQQKASSK